MKILISAAETSSDAHGAQLLLEIQKELESAPEGEREKVEAFGVGGPRLQEAGLRPVVDARSLLAMGGTEILTRLPAIFRALRLLVQSAQREKPDVVVVIDYPDFHFRLVRRLKRFLNAPFLYYIPPKVWVWRKGRLKFLKQFFDRILCILPFEEKFYRQEQVDARYVGSPLVDELPFDANKPMARKKLGVALDRFVLLVMPGSRPSELNRHFDVALDAAVAFSGKLGQRVQVLLPLPMTSSLEEGQARLKAWHAKRGGGDPGIDVRLSRGDSHLAMVAADLGLIKSGTSTLEAGILGLSHVIFYRGSALSHFIFRNFVRYRGPVGLSNLVSNWEPDRPFVFREVLMEAVQVDSLVSELWELHQNPQRQKEVGEAIQLLRKRVLGEGGSPSRLAAQEVIRLVKEKRKSKLTDETLSSSFHTSSSPSWSWSLLSVVASWGWSSVNGLRRVLQRWGVVKPIDLKTKVISVGNIQAGGAGKTPLVGEIARQASQRGKSVCILTRGYRSRWEKEGGVLSPFLPSLVGQDPFPGVSVCGDEAALLRILAPQAWIGVGADRVSAYRQVCLSAKKKFDLVLLDDGFQNFKIKKDLEVVALTSARWRERPFRDRSSALKYADLLVWTKGDKAPPPYEKANGNRVHIRYQLEELREEWGAEPQALQTHRPIWLVSGLADNRGALGSLIQSGYSVAKQSSYEDHASYHAREIFQILEEAKKQGYQVALTGKDWVKWQEFGVKRQEILVFEPQIKFQEGQENWLRILWDESSSPS